jgi:hypothetical protein
MTDVAIGMGGHPTARRRAVTFSEIIVAALAFLALLVAQWMLSSAIHGTNYDGGDGKMAQATILAAIKFGGLFQVTNINAIHGVGSQLLPMNVWANPSYWPFHIVSQALATDLSALIALACYAIACYIMARCFDLSVASSAVAAQLCIVLFAPTVLYLQLSTVFSLTAGNAVAYAPHMIALGLLARLAPGSWRTFALITAVIFALLLYSLCCDPIWTMISGVSWSVAFAVVTLSPLNRKAILVRAAALGCCVVLLFLTRALEYLYTLSQYTARAQFAAVIDRPRWAPFVSTVFSSSTTKYYYAACALGWLFGILALRGRPLVLVVAAATTGVLFVVYSIGFLLLNVPWNAPIPVYVEHSLFPLFLAAGVAGYWGALRAAASWLHQRLPLLKAPRRNPFAPNLLSIVIVAIVPAAALNFAINRSAPYADMWNEPYPNQPELIQFLTNKVGRAVGQPFRGSIHFPGYDYHAGLTITDLWRSGVPTVHEYSQLVTPQEFYILYAVFQSKVMGHLNGFVPFPTPSWNSRSWSTYFKVLQLLGARYYVADTAGAAQAEKAGYPITTMPNRPLAGEPGLWSIYELPQPNAGNYSPTEVLTAEAAADITAKMREEEFDFTRQVILTAPVPASLVPARDMRMSLIRGGLHVSGSSDGTSLVVLPQQFSHCLRARDPRVRLVRANLLMTGMIFSSNVDTDIVFDYGIFSPACRWIDLVDMRRLEMRIDGRQPHLAGRRLFVDWDEAIARFREAGIAAIGLLHREAPPASPAPEEPAPSGPAITQETVLADLPQFTTAGVALLGIPGLNAEVQAGGSPVVAGQPILRLVAVPTTGRHYLAAHFTALDKNQVYRITGWVKAPAGANVEMELSDELKPRSGTPANYGGALFDAAGGRVLSTTGLLKGRGIEQGPEGWQKIWVDLATSGGELVLTFGLVSKDGKEFKGDGRLGLTFGGVEVAARH